MLSLVMTVFAVLGVPGMFPFWPRRPRGCPPSCASRFHKALLSPVAPPANSETSERLAPLLAGAAVAAALAATMAGAAASTDLLFF